MPHSEQLRPELVLQAIITILGVLLLASQAGFRAQAKSLPEAGAMKSRRIPRK